MPYQSTNKHLRNLLLGILLSIAGLSTPPAAQAHVYEPWDVVYALDNPKRKLRIKFVFREDDKSDTTKKSLFTKVKGLFNTILDFSDNPPVRLEVSYTKDKKVKN